MKIKLLCALLCAAMITMLAGCGLGKKDDSATSDDADRATIPVLGDFIKVGVINNDPDESGYRAANDRDMQEKFTRENGYDAYFRYGQTNAEQIKYANELLQDGMDYLLISAQEKTGWDAVLNDAEAAGTDVILFDRTIDADESLYVASIVSDMEKEGQMAVKWLEDQKLKEYNIVHIQGKLGNDAQIGRTNALEKAVRSKGWNLITQQPADWSVERAKEIVETAINSGAEFNVIYAENDDMAKGAVAALDAAGISHGVGGDVIIMGFDCNRYALEELLNKNWNYDGQCNPYQASYIDDVIRKIRQREPIEEKTIIMEEKGFDAETITLEDIDNYGV